MIDFLLNLKLQCTGLEGTLHII